MGTSTDGILAYGYDLGGSEDWRIKNLGEYGELQVPWWTESEDDATEDEEGNSFGEAALFALCGPFGIERPEYGWRHEPDLPVTFVSHCSVDYPMWILAAKVIIAQRGYPQVLASRDLAVDPQWNVDLWKALKALGLEPKQEQAAWLLASDWG